MTPIVKTALGSIALVLAGVGAASAAEGWARSSSWLRAGPGPSYPAVTRIMTGEAVDVHGCIRRWSWCDVSVDGERGWYPGDRIALLRDGRRVVLPSVAGTLGLAILGFERNVYWDDHYRGRPFYERGARRDGAPFVAVHSDVRETPAEGRHLPVQVLPGGQPPHATATTAPPVERRHEVRHPAAPSRAAAPDPVAPAAHQPRSSLPHPAMNQGHGGAPHAPGQPCRPGACG